MKEKKKIHVHTACPCLCCLSMSPCCICMSPCCMSMQHIHAACPNCMSMLHAHAACPRFMSVSPCCMNMLREHIVSPSACFYDLENISSVYPSMSMIVIGHSLLYNTKSVRSDVWCFMDLHRWWWIGTSRTLGSKHLEYNPGSELNLFLWTTNNEQWKQKNRMENKSRTNDEQNSNKRRTTMK